MLVGTDHIIGTINIREERMAYEKAIALIDRPCSYDRMEVAGDIAESFGWKTVKEGAAWKRGDYKLLFDVKRGFSFVSMMDSDTLNTLYDYISR